MSANTEQKSALPILKLLGLITGIIVVATLVFSWLSSSSILYEYTTVTAQASVVARKIADQPDTKFFSLQYKDCADVIESVNLGKKKLDGKAPKKLKEIRTCLDQLQVGSEIEVKLTTRRQRMSGSRAGRINQIGPCVIPLLPTEIKVSGQGRCPWM